MKPTENDELLVQYGDIQLRARLAQGPRGHCSNKDCVKVIFEGDKYPKTINKKDILGVVGIDLSEFDNHEYFPTIPSQAQ